jgi:DNA primase
VQTQAPKPFIDFEELRRRIKIMEVIELLGLKLTSLRADAARLPCPLHGSRPGSRSLSVHLVRGVWRCTKCGEGGNLLDFYAACRELPLYDAARELAARLGIELPTKRPSGLTGTGRRWLVGDRRGK